MQPEDWKHVGIYVIRGKFCVIPTMARTVAGFYLDCEPVEVVPASDASMLAEIIARRITEGHPGVPTPKPDAFPEHVVLKHAKVRSNAELERAAVYWSVSTNSKTAKLQRHMRGSPRGFVPDPTALWELPTTLVSEFARIAAERITCR